MVGKPYWVAQRLLATAEAYWDEIDGAQLLEGVDLAQLFIDSPARFCSAIYALCIRGCSEDERAQVEFKLNQPPPWEAKRPPSAAEKQADAAAFMDAFAGFSRPGAAPSTL